ncbi:MAG: type II secretion system F family protein [Phycisphaerae bacterium]|jgi:tight adherence protein B|nr:type II secretion system F family protein [Phycisphaerae bacterium]
MILGAEKITFDMSEQIVSSVAIMVGTAIAIRIGARPLGELIERRERHYAQVIGGSLLMSIKPRSVTIMSIFMIFFFSLVFYLVVGSILGGLVGMVIGLMLPTVLIKHLREKRLRKLNDQLVPGIQTLSSGVRAGLNLIQALELVARDGPSPLRQEFAHLVREYEFGLGLEDAMSNASARIGSGDFGLLFAALLTHRERGGNLGETLDKICEAIREIQRLEHRVDSLTAQGRATARFLGAMPMVVLAIVYFIVDSKGVERMFVTTPGKVILAAILVLNILGFLWIRKIMDIDI